MEDRMTSKLVVNTIEADTGISSVSFASSISLSSTSKFFFSDAGIDIGPDTNINRPATGVLGFNINSSEKARIISSGAVGIGTDNPNGVVHIQQSVDNSSNYWLNAGNTVHIKNTHANGYASLRLMGGGTGSDNNAIVWGGTGSESLIFANRQNERLRITSAGRIGIGNVSSPDTMLHILMSSNTAYSATAGVRQGMKIFNDSNVDNGYASIELAATDGDDYYGSTLLSSIATGTNYSNDFAIQTRHGGNYGERFRIASSGNALFSTNQVKLYNSADTSNTYFYAENTGAGNAGIKMKNNQGEWTIIANDRLRFIDDDASIERLSIKSDGSVRVGDNSSFTANTNADNLVVGNTNSGNNHGISIISHTNSEPRINFASSADDDAGMIKYAFSSNVLQLYASGSEKLQCNSAGVRISDNALFNNWLHIGKNGAYVNLNSVGHDNSAGSIEGINWHSTTNYGVYRTKANWSNPYAQLRLDWPTGIAMAGGTSYGLSGVRFMCAALPSANNTYDLGTSALRWRDVYCNQGAFNNSDVELKQDIASLTAAEMKAAKRLSALFKTYRWKDAVEEKGTDKARTHTGMIAQQIQAAMSAEGLDATKYGLFGIDEWYENDKKEIITLDQLKDNIPDPLDSSKTISPMSTEGYTKVTRYSVRYTELLSFIAAYNDQRFADLESRVAALEGS